MTIFSKEVMNCLLLAPPHELDPAAIEMIKKWSEPPTPLQVLEVLDKCIHNSLASQFVITVLRVGYDDLCALCNVKHEDVVKDATWRTNGS